MPQEHTLPPADIPDIAFLTPQAEWVGVLRAIGGGGSRDPVTWPLQLNVVRLADAAVRDYQLGRHCINSFHARSPQHFGLLHIIEGATHFENCIWHLERFIKHARAVRACPTAEPELKSLIPKTSIFLQSGVESKVTQLRHALAHLEGKNIKVPSGTGLALLPQNQGLVMGEHLILWSELVSWLAEANVCASNVARFKPVAKPEA